MKKKMNKTIVFKVDKNSFKTKDKRLDKIADKVVKEIDEHFKKEGKKAWPLGASHYITDVFYIAFGIQLENYLFKALFKKGGYMLKSGKNGLMIDRSKPSKRKKKS
jgi:hypothetical protein